MCLLFLTAMASQARAQIVNVQSVLAEKPRPGLSGSLAGSVDWRTGNQKFVFLSLSGVARLSLDKNLWIAIVSGESKQSAGESLAGNTFAHLRYRRTITDVVGAETFIQHAFDNQRRLETRGLAGAGVRLTLLKGDMFNVDLGIAYMFEYELLDNDAAQPDAGATQKNHRLSSYLFFSFDVADNVQFLETVYFQPRLDEPEDLRLLSDSSLVLRLTKRLNLATSFSVSWDRAPPAGIEGLDTSLVQSASVDF